MNKKKRHRKLNKKRVFTLLIFLLGIIFFIIFLLNLRVKNILIIGNTYIKDSEINFETIRGFDGIKETSINVNGETIKIAIVQQMENLEKLLELINPSIIEDALSCL